MTKNSNFCTMFQFNKSSSATTTKANIHLPSVSYDSTLIGSIGVSSGKWYYEARVQNNYGTYYVFGWVCQLIDDSYLTEISSSQTGSLNWSQLGTTVIDGSNIAPDPSVPSYYNSNTKIVGTYLDLDNNKVYWHGANNFTQQADGTARTPTAGNGYDIPSGMQGQIFYPMIGTNAVGAPGVTDLNFGQDSTFQGQETRQNNADSNGFGDFYYAPSANYLSLCSANVPTSSDIDPGSTTSDYPTKQHGVVTYTGNATTGQAITGMGFQPDLIIAKMRSSSQSGFVSDTSRGINKFTFTDQSASEQSGGGYATVYNSFDSDGFTLGTSGSGPNDNSATYCAWGWRANGGTTSSNTDGDITSTVQVNQAAGFSIVQYTGVSTATTATVGHGLGKAPTFIIHKVLNATGWHFVRGVPGMTNASTVRNFNPNGSPTDVSGSGGALVAPTSSTFNINNYTGIGGGGYNYVAYCWAPIEGYSKFGIYKGNGSTDGPYIATGFRPKTVLIFGLNYGIENVIWDTERSKFNVMDDYLRWGRSSAEGSSSSFAIDVYSNGFKIRTSAGDVNTDGATSIWAAWGDVPAKYNNAF